MRKVGVAWLLWMCLTPARAEESTAVRGQVVDATTREPVARAQVRIAGSKREAVTGAGGGFEFDHVALPAELQVICAGYRPIKVIASRSGDLVEIAIVPDTLRRVESVDVTAGPFALEGVEAVGLAGGELRNLASVLADDPLRAVQSLPGVYGNNDFQSQLSLRGAGFHRAGIYVDGILLHAPYHTLQADPGAASLTILSSDLLQSAVLHSGAPPLQFPDRTAAALDLRLKEGDRDKLGGRASASASNAALLLEGPLSGRRRGSWLISARKSYLQYLIEAASDEPSIAFGFTDVQGRLAQDAGRGHTLTMSLMQGRSGLDRSGAELMVGLNTMFFSDYHYTLASLQSRWTPRASVLVNNTFAWMRERFENRNRESAPLAAGHYGEWIYNSDNRWQWSETAALTLGASLRRLRDDGFADRRTNAPPFFIRLDSHRGTALRSGGHLAQQLATWKGRVQIRFGARLDRHSQASGVEASPSAAITVTPAPGTQIHLAWGQYVQYAELSRLASPLGGLRLAPERAIHQVAAIEQRLGERTRLRAEAYQRLDRDLIFRPLFEPRLLDNRVYGGSLTARYENSQRGYARGVQFFVQRRSANGLTGWLSYAYGVARLRDAVARTAFPSDFDQRHTASVYASYRPRPTVNLSGRWNYGSGFPVTGFFRGSNPFFLSAQRNALRVPAHHRLDLRANKTFARKGWQWTLYAEVINLYNRDNVRFDDLNGFDARTQQALLSFDTLFPVAPSAGVAIEF